MASSNFRPAVTNWTSRAFSGLKAPLSHWRTQAICFTLGRRMNTIGAGFTPSGFEYRGIHHVSWWGDEYALPAAATSRAEAAKVSANWAAVLTTWYQANATANAIEPHPQRTPTDAAVTEAVRDFRRRGIKVILKPHVEGADNTWRGQIKPDNPDAWFESYTAFILKYAQMAQLLGAEMLCIGTELKLVTGAENRQRWLAVIAAIRANYASPLTYAANAAYATDEYSTVSSWDQLDLIGLDCYFPLTSHPCPSLGQLVAAWRKNADNTDIVKAIEKIHRVYNKPVIFTEIGYRSLSGANIKPWDHQRTGTYDPVEQQNCIEAAYRVWSEQSAWLRGFFWWNWPFAIPADNTDYTVRGKPAADILRAWNTPRSA